MTFDLTEDQIIIRDMVRRFAEDFVAPRAEAWDEQAALAPELFVELGQLGLLGLHVPEAFGGAGLDAISGAYALEELARHSGAAALAVACHGALCCRHIALAGDDAQKQRWLPALATGELLGSWAAFESSDLSLDAIETTAHRHGDMWRIDGRKPFVTLGATSNLVLVLARTAGDAGTDGAGASFFLVERDTSGLSARTDHQNHGMRACDTVDLVFEAVEVPDSHRVGVPGRGLDDARSVLATMNMALAAIAVGLGRGALEEALAYSADRKQFGQSLNAFQAIQFKLADMATELDASRLLVLQAALALDADGADADAHTPARAQAAMARLMASEVALRACDQALQIHGGYGYTREYPVERLLRDARRTTLGEGTNDMLRIELAHLLLEPA